MCLFCRFDLVNSSRRRLRKWWTNGRTRERCPSLPIVDSNSFVLTRFEFRMTLIPSVHAVNLLSGREMISQRKSHLHPRMILISLRLASASSLVFDIICVRGIGSC